MMVYHMESAESGKSNLITNGEGRDKGNEWDSRGCVDVFGRRRYSHVINMMQSIYEQENINGVEKYYDYTIYKEE